VSHGLSNVSLAVLYVLPAMMFVLHPGLNALPSKVNV
jgi:hypothetical protein